VQTLINLGSRYVGPRRSNAIVGDVLPTPKLRRAIQSEEPRGA
jgi:hypothetical protein